MYCNSTVLSNTLSHTCQYPLPSYRLSAEYEACLLSFLDGVVVVRMGEGPRVRTGIVCLDGKAVYSELVLVAEGTDG